MKRSWVLTIGLVLLWPSWSWAAWAFVQSNVASTNAVQLTSVAAGNLVVVCTKYEGTTGVGDVTASDGTSSLTLGPHEYNDAASDLGLVAFYLLNSNAGTKTYTVTFGAAKSFYVTTAMELDYGSATATFDTSAANEGLGVAVTTGDITTTGADIAVAACHSNYNGETSNTELIGVSAATDAVRAAGGSMWWKAGSLSGAGGTATILSSYWIGSILSFNATAGAGSEIFGFYQRKAQ